MAYCGPAYAIPSCASSPVVGYGSAGLGYGGLGGISHGYGYGAVGAGVPSASLGILSGVEPSCINQIPPAEVVIQPPPVVMTIPGPILSATGEPVSVGGNTPCAVSYGGSPIAHGALGSFTHGGGALGASALGSSLLGRRYGLGRRSSVIVGRRGSACLPCQ